MNYKGKTLENSLIHKLNKSRDLSKHKLVRSGSFRMLALKANLPSPQRPDYRDLGYTTIMEDRNPVDEIVNLQSSSTSSSLIPHLIKSYEAITKNPEPFGI